MSCPQLPLEIFVAIARVSISSYRALLAVPDFARWTIAHPNFKDIFARFIDYHGMHQIVLGRFFHSVNDMPSNGSGELCIWRKLGKDHRDNDLPALINGDLKIWCQNGLNHRVTRDENGYWNPAYIFKKCCTWYIEDVLIKTINDNCCFYPNDERENIALMKKYNLAISEKPWDDYKYYSAKYN